MTASIVSDGAQKGWLVVKITGSADSTGLDADLYLEYIRLA